MAAGDPVIAAAMNDVSGSDRDFRITCPVSVQLQPNISISTHFTCPTTLERTGAMHRLQLKALHITLSAGGSCYKGGLRGHLAPAHS
jgi:hypothetical protein